MTNFLDPNDLDETDLDLGIFEEEEPEEETEEVDTPEVTEEKPLEQVDDVVVDTETGEVVAEDDEVLNFDGPGSPEDVDDEGEPAMTEEEILKHMDELGLTPAEKPDIPPEAQKAVEEVKEALEGGKKLAPKNNIQAALDLVTFKHVQEMEPIFVKFEDCNFGVFTEEIKEAQEIIDWYYENGFDTMPPNAEYDLGKLSAIMARISRATGYIQGVGDQVEPAEKATRAAFYVEMKEIKDAHNLKLSDKDTEYASKMLTAKYLKKFAGAGVKSRMATNFWFAVRKFIDYLESAIARNLSDAKLEEHTEAAVFKTPPRYDGPAPEYKKDTKPEPIKEDGGCEF